MSASPIRYATNGDIHLAYRTIGEGPLDLVLIEGAITNLEVLWDVAEYRSYCEQLASFSRSIIFDKRGMGLSDRVRIGTLEERMDDVRAIMDDAGSESAVLMGVSEGGPMSMLFAATHPERAQALVLCGAEVKEETTEDWPWGESTRAEIDEYLTIENMLERWGKGLAIGYFARAARTTSGCASCSAVYRCNLRARTTQSHSCGWPTRSTSGTSLRRSTRRR